MIVYEQFKHWDVAKTGCHKCKRTATEDSNHATKPKTSNGTEMPHNHERSSSTAPSHLGQELEHFVKHFEPVRSVRAGGREPLHALHFRLHQHSFLRIVHHCGRASAIARLRCDLGLRQRGSCRPQTLTRCLITRALLSRLWDYLRCNEARKCERTPKCRKKGN